jgi:hypothetical protein
VVFGRADGAAINAFKEADNFDIFSSPLFNQSIVQLEGKSLSKILDADIKKHHHARIGMTFGVKFPRRLGHKSTP